MAPGHYFASPRAAERSVLRAVSRSRAAPTGRTGPAGGRRSEAGVDSYCGSPRFTGSGSTSFTAQSPEWWSATKMWPL